MPKSDIKKDVQKTLFEKTGFTLGVEPKCPPLVEV